MDLFDMDAYKNIYKEYANIGVEDSSVENSSIESTNLKKINLNSNMNIMICSCGSILIKDVSNYICKNCGLIKYYEYADSEYENIQKDQSSVGRIRIVGQGNNYFQSDFYRSSNPATSETQKAQILDELLAARLKYIEKHGIAFSISACKTATDYYNTIQNKLNNTVIFYKSDQIVIDTMEKQIKENLKKLISINKKI